MNQYCFILLIGLFSAIFTYHQTYSSSTNANFADINCTIDTDCWKQSNNSKCVKNECVCLFNYIRNPNDHHCIKFHCDNSTDCSLWFPNSYCQMKECQCYNGYELNSETQLCDKRHFDQHELKIILPILIAFLALVIIGIIIYYRRLHNRRNGYH